MGGSTQSKPNSSNVQEIVDGMPNFVSQDISPLEIVSESADKIDKLIISRIKQWEN